MRRCVPEDEPGLRELWARCFEDTPRYIDYFFQNRFAPENAVCIEEEDRIAAAMHMPGYRVDLRGEVVDTAYLVGVATLPEYRMRGWSKALIRSGLRLCRERGYRFSHLYPFSHDFYGKMGYGIANRFTMAELSGSAAKTRESRGRVLPIQVEDATKLLGCYQTQMRGKTGFVLRTKADMENRLREYLLEGFGYFVERNGFTTGYVLCYRDHDVIAAEELLYEDGDALNALLAAMGRSGAEKVRGPILQGAFGDGFDRVWSEDGAMARVIDLDGLSLHTSTGGSRSMLLRISDDFLTEQSGVYLMEVKDGRVSFTRVNADQWEGTLSIDRLSEMILGSYLWSGEQEAWKELLKTVFPPACCVLFEKY